ncbi:MAG: alpha/beta hydrolase [Actinobacteria bacterium]|nr:MAG: alpha/beta hydrolase [Actinomycetota bacterium]
MPRTPRPGFGRRPTRLCCCWPTASWPSAACGAHAAGPSRRSMSSPPKQSVAVPGGQLAYLRSGSGPPLLVINGFAATGEDWDPTFLQALAARHELIVPDNRGIGASSDDGGPLGIDRLAGDCASLIQALGLGPASILGWSMGGFVAQTMALDHPGCVGRLVLLATDPGGPGAQLGDPNVLAQIADLSPPPEEQARRLLELLLPAELARRLYSEAGDIVAAARARLTQDLIDRQMDAMAAWHREGVGDRLADLSVPTLIAAGTDDRVIPASNSLSLTNTIPGAWLIQFAGAGHGLMAQYPKALGRLVDEFLAL